MGIHVLSLFDGISVARQALHLANIPVETYYCSEIDKNAIKISIKNWKDNIQLGDVKTITKEKITKPIDLLIGGSPCQDLSIAKKGRKGLDGDRSALFWEYIRLKNELNPKWFILENVASMLKKDKDIISKAMGCEPVMFNASLVSAQTRKRYFWTNIKFELPEDRGIILKDILQADAEVDERMVNKDKKAYTLTSSYSKATNSNAQIEHNIEKKQRTMVKVGHIGNSDAQGYRVYSPEGKSCTLSANGGGMGAKTGLYKIDITENPKDAKGLFITKDNKLAVVEGVKLGYAIIGENQSVDLSYANCKTTRRGRVGDKAKNLMTGMSIHVNQNYNIRKLTPIECERLQSLPDNYTEGIANTNRYKCIGNAFNADVIKHIIMGIPPL